MKNINLNEKIVLESAVDEKGVAIELNAGIHIILPALRQGPANNGQGINFEEMGRVIKIIEKCKTAEENTGEVLLENTEHVALLSCIKNFKFRSADVGLYNYIKKLSDLGDAEVSKLKDVKDTRTHKKAS